MFIQGQTKKMFKEIDNYFTEKFLEFGRTAKGVDWKDADSQNLRFKQLLKIVNTDESFTINDLGCGYGEMYQYLKNNFNNFQYFGYDLSEEMVKNAIETEKGSSNCNFYKINNASEIKKSDYTIESGIFNKKFDYTEKKWLPYIIQTIETMNEFSKKGFSFNILTKYSDKEYMRDDLYYADPCFFFDYCKKNFSRNVSLLHDYDLYEFTILVRK